MTCTLSAPIALAVFFYHLHIIGLFVCAAAGAKEDNPHKEEGAEEGGDDADSQRDMAVARDVIAVL